MVFLLILCRWAQGRVLAGPIQADFVTIGVVQVCVPPAPRHHARHLRNVKVLRLQLAAKVVEFPNLKVQTYALAGERGSRSCHVQSDGAVAARGAQPCIDRFTVSAVRVLCSADRRTRIDRFRLSVTAVWVSTLISISCSLRGGCAAS